MRFLADMGISPLTVSYLQEKGHEAVHLIDRGQQQLEDREILARAREESRILLVHDLDFSDLVAAGGRGLLSVIVFRLRNMTPPSVNQRLQKVLDRHDEQLEVGAIFSVTETQIRWRRLPFEPGE
jgi:predicted nuclease of predicted toxin-antitoxin system